MRVYLLEFDRPETLARAFRLVLESDRSTSCTAESERRRLRFVAPERPADSLIERIYLDGGLTWCTRHRSTSSPDGVGSRASVRRLPCPRAAV